MPLDAIADYDPLAPAPAAPAAPAKGAAPRVVAAPGPSGLLLDPTTGMPAPADMPDAQGRLGVIPVIDVGAGSPDAKPGEPGSQFRPVAVGQTEVPGKALPAAAVPPQEAAAAAPPTTTPAVPGGAMVPTTPSVPPAQAADAYDPLAGAASGQPTQGAQPPNAAEPAAVPSSVRGEELRNQPWYQSFKDNLEGALASVTHGESFGLDEILDPIMPALVEHITTGKPFSQAYDEALQFQRVPRKEFEREHPVAGTATELAGSLPGTVLASPLFGTAGPAASTLARVGTGARNVAAGTALGGATGATMTEGNLGQRLEGAKQGAEIGGALTAAAPLVPAIAGGLRQAVTPSARIPGIVGRTVAEVTGGVPRVQPSPIPSVPMDLAQATGSPEAASALDTLNAMNPAAAQRARSAQNSAMLDAITGRAPNEPALLRSTSNVPEVIAARGSARATKALQEAARISRTQEQRLWNTPALSEPNMSTWTTKRALTREVSAMRRNDPDLALAFDESPVLQRIARGLRMFPQKASANQLNRFSSQLRAVARDTNQPGDIRHVATRLANAVQDGMAQAPEVVGQAPATQAQLDAVNSIKAREAAAPKPEAALPETIGRLKRPVDAITALIDAGGLQDPQGELAGRDVDFKRHRFRGEYLSKIINKKTGMSPNRAREFLRDNGYLTSAEAEDEHIAANLVDEHIAGIPRYRAGDLADVQEWEALDRAKGVELDRHEQALADVNQAASDAGVRITPDEADHAAEMMGNDPTLHPEQAVRDALAAGEAAALEANAQRLAFGPPGLPPSATGEPLPDMQVLRDGIKPNPDLVRDLKAARAFTKREAEVLGHASFDNIVRRNSRGNETVVPGTAMSKFFDFANGVERPGAIANVGRFLDDIRSEWLKLSAEEQGNVFDPATILPVQHELREGARNYILGKMLDQISSTERDMTGNRMLQYRRAMDWIDTNRSMLERSGLFTHDELDLVDRFRDTAQMIQRGADLGRVAGSPTFTRAMHPVRFVDLFTGPFMGRALGATAGAALGGLLTTWIGEAAIGAMIGAEIGAVGSGPKLLQAIYSAPREKLLRALDEAFRNPTIAHDLAQKATTAGAARPSEQTRNWILSLIATEPAATGARVVGVPANEPAPHATGGAVGRVAGPVPANGDDGYITAQRGEYVLQRGAVAKYGGDVIDAINSGRVDPAALRRVVGAIR